MRGCKLKVSSNNTCLNLPLVYTINHLHSNKCILIPFPDLPLVLCSINTHNIQAICLSILKTALSSLNRKLGLVGHHQSPLVNRSNLSGAHLMCRCSSRAPSSGLVMLIQCEFSRCSATKLTLSG
jgi:hypothetical protein